MLKGSTVKEVNVYCRQNNFTVIAWSMFSQRKNGMSSYGNTIPRNLVVWYVEEKLLESMNCKAAPMWRFLCAKQWKKCSSVGGRKKSAWTDLDQVNFQKKSSMSKCSNRKIGMDWSRQSQKGLFSGKCLLIFFRTGHPGVAKAFCTSMACPWQEV